MNSVILAFESSCDDTAVAAVTAEGKVVAQASSSQIDQHQKYGGVVPEVASRSHFENVDLLTEEVLKKLGADFQINCVAATQGPGLVGPLLVGASYAEGLASGLNVPFRGVHHLRGHLASALLADASDPSETLSERAQRMFPALVLLVSGGHTQVLRVESDLQAHKLADTADDAAGECLDKCAKLMGLPYPGGPAIEALALRASAADREAGKKILKKLPKPRSTAGFSFSGLKTAVRLELEAHRDLSATPAFCWALQERVGELFTGALDLAYQQMPTEELRTLVFCGGVSANARFRILLRNWAEDHELELSVAPLIYCTDNAAMIAAAAWVQNPSLELKTVTSRIPLTSA